MQPKGRVYIRNEYANELPNGNPLAGPRAGRPNKRIRLWEIESASPTIAALERAYERSLAEVDALGSRYTEAVKSGKFTEQGLRDEITQAALKSMATFKAGRNAIDKARDEAAELRKQTALPKPDPTDVVAFLRRQEIRNRLAAMDDQDRHAFVTKHAASNADIGMAIIEMPPEFSKVADTDRELLIEHTLEATHGPKLAELRELERAIEVANSAIEAGWENHGKRLACSIKWDEMAKDIKPAAFAPWLRQIDGKIKVLPIDLENPKPSYGVRDATPEEIENGRYFKNIDEYRAANA